MQRRTAMRNLAFLALAACAPDPAPVEADVTDTAGDMPGHNSCLPVGEVMDEATCLEVIDHSGRSPNQSYDQSYAPKPEPDWRVDDPEYAWLLTEVERCTCVCCHNSDWGAPAVHRWDVAFEGPWIDSMSDWSMEIFGGLNYSDNQVLPSSDPARFRALIEAELLRRKEARLAD